MENIKKHIEGEFQQLGRKRNSFFLEVAYMEIIARRLLKGDIANVDIAMLDAIIKKIDIEEYEIFLELKSILEKFSVNIDEFENNITREKEKELIMSTFKLLQENMEYQDEFDHELVKKFIDVLVTIIESLYDKEIENIRSSEKYLELNDEIKTLEEIIEIINKSDDVVLTVDEKNKIFNYLVSSNVENKIQIFTGIASKWIEQTKREGYSSSISLVDFETLEEDTEIESFSIEDVLVRQREELETLTEQMTKEDWERLIKEGQEILKNSNQLTESEKRIIEKILLINLKSVVDDLNISKELIGELTEISVSSREGEYLSSLVFDMNLVGVDLIINLLPNIENTDLNEVIVIIKKIIEKYKTTYLMEDELVEIRELLQTEYAGLEFVLYDDEKILDLEDKFLKFNGSKQKVLNYDRYSNNVIGSSLEYDYFAMNTFKKIIKLKMDELRELISSDSGELIEKKGIDTLKEEIKKWIDIYELSKLFDDYKNYTVEEVSNLTFDSRNAIIFLRGDSGRTLYEEGLVRNGESSGKKILDSTCKELKEIMITLVKNTIQLIHPNYGRFIDDVKRKLPSGNFDTVTINGKVLKRASQYRESARISFIKLDVAPENKVKLNMAPNQGILLLLGAYEVNFNGEENTYRKMRIEAEKYQEKIKEIMDVFNNPNTPREVLLEYIADSYGLLENLLPDEESREIESNRPRVGGGRS